MIWSDILILVLLGLFLIGHIFVVIYSLFSHQESKEKATTGDLIGWLIFVFIPPILYISLVICLQHEMLEKKKMLEELKELAAVNITKTEKED